VEILTFLQEHHYAELLHTVIIFLLLHRLLAVPFLAIYSKFLDAKIEVYKEVAADISLAATSLKAIGEALKTNCAK